MAHNLEKENSWGLSWYIAGSTLIFLLLLEFITSSFSETSILIRLFIIAAIAMFVIVQSANYAVTAISHYAKQTGISDYLIGFVVVSIGTAFPDISTSIFASLAGKGDLVLGSVVGACILNMSLIIGLMAIIGGKLKFDKSIQKTVAIILAMMVFAVGLGIDGKYSRIDGIILLIGVTGYLIVMILKEGKTGKIKESVKFKNIWKDIVVFGGTLTALLLSARWLVYAASEIATKLNVPNYSIGLILVALGTTTPELIVGIKSVLEGVTEIGIGNLIGGIVINYFLVLGIGATMAPIIFDITTFLIGGGVLLFTTALILLFTNYKEITKKHGFLLVGIYILFLIVQIKVMRNVPIN
ncbi:sodium:calcium antiporter [Candidatus Woesearchaeota archaeon]|nr:sodium:calcium antiporter [Candidatus Woesearchaeota archaeon]